jgi:hypothetical protein
VPLGGAFLPGQSTTPQTPFLDRYRRRGASAEPGTPPWPSILTRRPDMVELQKPPAPMRRMPPLTSPMCPAHLH